MHTTIGIRSYLFRSVVVLGIANIFRVQATYVISASPGGGLKEAIEGQRPLSYTFVFRK